MGGMNKKLRIAAAQFSPVYLDIDKTVEKACAIIEDAANKGVKFVVFPEVFVSGYPDWTWLIPNSKGSELNELYMKLLENSISIPDRYTDALCSVAKKHSIYVVIGVNERNVEKSNTTIFNSMLYISDKGKVMGVHRKLIPTGGERLIWGQGDGSTLHCFETEIGRLGGLICWENFMPLARNAMYEKGIQLYCAPTWDKSPKWLLGVQWFAKEGGAFVISVCQALRKDDVPEDLEFRHLYPKDRDWINIGNSCIINPKGDIIAGPLEKEEGLLLADIDLSEIVQSKRLFDVTGHYSRPDVFEYGVNR